MDVLKSYCKRRDNYEKNENSGQFCQKRLSLRYEAFLNMLKKMKLILLSQFMIPMAVVSVLNSRKTNTASMC